MDLVSFTEFPRFLELPGDIVKLFMMRYFDPLSVLRCIRTCKLLKSMISNTELEVLRIKVMKQIAYECQVASGVTTLKPECELCGAELSYIRNIDEHMADHARRLNKGKPIDKVTDFWRTPISCKLCDAPFAGSGPHMANGCPLREVTCENYKIITPYPWAELICSKPKGYWKEIRNHTCIFRCRKCLQSFNFIFDVGNGDNSFYDHLRTCEFGKEILKTWHVAISQ